MICCIAIRYLGYIGSHPISLVNVWFDVGTGCMSNLTVLTPTSGRVCERPRCVVGVEQGDFGVPPSECAPDGIETTIERISGPDVNQNTVIARLSD